MIDFKVGSFYRTRDGRKVWCLGFYVNDTIVQLTNCVWVFKGTGRWSSSTFSENDIVSEWTDKLEVGKKYYHVTDTKKNPTVHTVGLNLPDGSGVVISWSDYKGETQWCVVKNEYLKDYTPVPKLKTVWIGVRKLGYSDSINLIVRSNDENKISPSTFNRTEVDAPVDYIFPKEIVSLD